MTDHEGPERDADAAFVPLGATPDDAMIDAAVPDSAGVPPPSDTGRPLDEIERSIAGFARKMNALCYEMLVDIREFDERRGWARHFAASCAQWLHWRCDIGLSAAREHVRVAHALKTLPLMAAAFAGGGLSYSKVRALTRSPELDDEASLLEMASTMTAEQVEQHCRRRRNTCDASRADAIDAHERRSLRSWRSERRGVLTIVLELPLEDGALFVRAIDRACTERAAQDRAPDDATPWEAIQADAAVTLARTYLDDDEAGTTSSSAANHHQVMIHVDQDALSGGKGESDLPIETVRRLCCDASLVPIVENHDGEPLAVGRRQRVVSTALRRALRSRDRGCAFPGCTHTRFVDAHHIRHWADGGETRLDNLVLLCSSHHHMLHEGGYAVSRDSHGKRVFKRPDGRVVPACGYRVEDEPEDIGSGAAASVGVTGSYPSAEARELAGETPSMASEPLSDYQVRPPQTQDLKRSTHVVRTSSPGSAHHRLEKISTSASPSNPVASTQPRNCLRSITPSPIIPRSLSRSVVGTNQSQTWNARTRCSRPARST